MHSEGILSGELKHGPLAMIDEKMPCMMIITRDNTYTVSVGWPHLVRPAPRHTAIYVRPGLSLEHCSPHSCPSLPSESHVHVGQVGLSYGHHICTSFQRHRSHCPFHPMCPPCVPCGTGGTVLYMDGACVVCRFILQSLHWFTVVLNH